MLKAMCAFCSQPLATLFALLLLVDPSAMLAADRTKIAADPCGPMMALQNAGHSVNLLPSLQHEDGSPLRPEEVRTAPDKYFYLLGDAKPDRAATRTFLNGEVKQFGQAQGGCALKGPDCTVLLAEANNDVGRLTGELKAAGAYIRDQQGKFTAANKRADLAEQNAKGKVSWWWLLLPLLAVIVLGVLWFFARRERDAETHRADTMSERLAAANIARRTELASLEQAVRQRDAAVAERDTANAEREVAVAEQNRLEEDLRATQDELTRSMEDYGRLSVSVEKLMRLLRDNHIDVPEAEPMPVHG
jgi:hypothetical protein